MKRRVLSLFAAVFLLGLFNGSSAFADVDNFYFQDFTADYYLSRDEEGVSHLKVVEKLTAVFPSFNQNKGICRDIPFTNQDGKNRTMDKPSEKSLNLKRNGLPEPVGKKWGFDGVSYEIAIDGFPAAYRFWWKLPAEWAHVKRIIDACVEYARLNKNIYRCGVLKKQPLWNEKRLRRYAAIR